MNTQALKQFLALEPLGSTDFHHEHDAIHAGNVRDAETLFRCLGYHILRNVNGSRAFFAQKMNHRLEIMDSEWAPEHTAFAVARREELAVTIQTLRAIPGQFEIIESKEDDEFFGQVLFRHRHTGSVMQVVWRKTPLFANVFGEGFAQMDEFTGAE